MAVDLNDIPTFGDGVMTGCTQNGTGEFCGANCTAGVDTNCDGEPNDSRITVAKAALRNMILAFGDVEFSLARFPQTSATNTSCLSINDFECNAAGPFVTSYGNPQCNTGASIPDFATCNFDWESTIPAACRPDSGGRPGFRTFGAGSPTVCTNYNGGCVVAGRSGDFLVDFSDTGAFAGLDNTTAMLSWIDDQETGFNASTTIGNFCNSRGGGDCELRPTGGTPLAGLMDAVEDRLTSTIIPADSVSACRPYSVILITDGGETCGGNVNASAAALEAQGIDVYVIGLAVSAGTQAQLNGIAAAGGTTEAFFADDPDTLSAGLAAIIADSLLVENCGFGDEDCDGIIDEGWTKWCSDPSMPAVLDLCTEPDDTCDGVDSDCDGTIDEGFTNACGGCGAVPEEVCDGVDNNCNGVIDEGGVCAGCVPAGEICDNLDNDCDGRTDEGVSRACGNSVGICTIGTQICTAGMFGACSGRTPEVEECDGLDNDCDGAIDGNTASCGSSVGACRPGTRICVDGTFGACIGGISSSPELCDSLDNDCDSRTDEGSPGGGAACGTAVGVCTEGTTRCVAGSLICDGGTGGGPEVCNGLDDDCDGLFDEGNPGGGGSCGASNTGECDFGAFVCEMGALVCRGETGPTDEICDGRDNDCDASTDEGDPEGGEACGDGTGECEPGTTACTGGMLVCEGAVGPTPEICDGLDNNCNGVEDEGIGVGAPCGTDAGECSPGVNICRDGMLVCDGATMTREEVCNNLDDDCDGTIDEALPLGGACGAEEGICMPGALQCIEGDEICVGEVPAGVETCDCSDNDCDGSIDEETGEGLCPGDSACVECACSSPCRASEFGFTCPPGRTAFLPDGPGTDACFCVTPRCEEDACGMETVERDGDTLCAPGADPATCTCKNNACTFPCDGVICEGGTVCRPDSGRCVEDSCRGLGCDEGELCDVATGACEEDPCASIMCDDGEACRDGVCEGTCVGVECPGGQECRAGECVADLCDGVTCAGGEACDPASGDCVDDMCVSIRCPLGLVCDPITGDCEGDPCEGLTCPDELVCSMGECVDPAVVNPDGGVGVDAGTEDAGTGGTQVLASGGGGCACDAAGATSTRSPVAPATLILLFLGFMGWRRSRRSFTEAVRTQAVRTAKIGSGVAAGLALLLSGGCDVDPFCLDCVDGAIADAGPLPDTSVDVGIDVESVDAGTPDVFDSGPDTGGDACLGAELCNDIDDDCDGNIDEEIDEMTDINNCGGCGILCAPAAAFGVCRGGECFIDECDVNARDLNMDPADGCEYTCLPTGEDDTLCDLRDNDCDGEVDEDINFPEDPVNCGSCARVCRFAHVTSPSCTAGECTFEAGGCEENFYDVNGVPDDGCEYSCTPADPAIEICNGRDDDCDGMVDEGDPGGGAACGASDGACVQGVDQCVAGAVVCVGGVREATESCNGVDDDCDGITDENNPDGGRLCGESIGACQLGREVCTDGALACEGDVGPVAETCDGLDNDCDGDIDNGNPGGGASCGETRGICMAGSLSCSGGTLTCVGATGGTIEACDSLDNDCDGNTDETFSLQTDLNNCGVCGRSCSFTNGFPTCTAGSCVLAGCDTGFVDRDGNPANGCEYACNFTGNEICNGLDDDCDGSTDETLTPPANFCNPNGLCAGTAATCNGATGWECNYPATYEETETRCDGVDNDCDGGVDETYDTLGDLCSNGVGGCQRFGQIVCDGVSAIRCNAAAAGTPSTELCNGIDDDCDDTTDEDIAASIPMVDIGGGVEMMQYEASRTDATLTENGSSNTFACSRAGVLPWVNVTWAEARDACEAHGAGWGLCSEDAWEDACEGPSTCDWSYSTSCTTSSDQRCNGLESGLAMMSVDITSTGDYAACYTRYGASSTERIYDLSGNVKEWTSTERGSSNIHAIRGGSYNNVEDGRTCQFDFTVGNEVFAFVNTGFRCCHTL